MLDPEISKEGEWIPTTCSGCFNACAIQARAKGGKVVEIRGEPKVTSSRGKICGKGIARLVELYSPNRITKPLKRTNPQKGIGVDPKWVEISREEAMDIIVEKLQKIREEDPRELVIGHFDLHNANIAHAFGGAFGTPNCEYFTVSCGNGLHTLCELTVGSVNMEIDLDYCNYIVLWGSQLGHGVNNNPLANARDMANARRRGAKLVVIDPICGHAAAKADEWIPILPGTDGAMALGMLNVLINDLGIYDREYLKKATNSPYLIGENGHYVRSMKSGKPLVWDSVNGEPRDYDDESIGDYAIEGTYTVGDVKCRPAFDLIKEHIEENYDLDRVSKITTVPAKTISRIAMEFGKAAQIGSTITIAGHRLPYRPAGVEFKKGVNQHRNSFFSCHSLQLLNIIVGNINVVGGVLGTNPKGPSGLWDVVKSEDGLRSNNAIELMSGGEGSYSCFLKPYPAREIAPPATVDYRSLFPLSGYITSITTFVLADPERFKLPYKPKVLIISRTNPVATTTEPKKTAQALLNMEFILGFGTKIDETLEFADVVLPEAHDLERYWLFPSNLPMGFVKPGPGDWYFQISQPVVDPPPGVQCWNQTLIDIAERLGILDELNNRINRRTGLGMIEFLALQPGDKPTIGDIAMRMAKMTALVAGKEITPDTFTAKEPALILGEKTIEESYHGSCPVEGKRLPVYFEHFIDAGKKVEEVTRELGLDWWDVSHYHPLPEWHPCGAHEEDGKEYDLFLSTSKIALNYHSLGADNPWIDDVCKRNPMDQKILVNTETARKKEIQDGDVIWVESRVGKVKGTVRVTECVHPQVVGILGIFGQWARAKQIARGKGANANALMAFDWDNMDTLSGQLDVCARVKIYRS